METQNQNIQQNMPSEEPKKNWFLSRKFLWSVICILLLVLVIGCVYLYKAQKESNQINSVSQQKSTDIIAKTYTNNEYGFNFTYPQNWIVSNCVGSPYSNGNIYINSSCDNDSFYDEFYGHIFVNNAFNSKVPDPCGQYAQKNIVIDKIPAIVCERLDAKIGRSDDVYFTTNNYDFTLNLVDASQSSTAIDSLLSSIKFTKPTRTSNFEFIGILNGSQVDGSLYSIDENGQKTLIIPSTNKYVDGRIGKLTYPAMGDKLFFVGNSIYSYSISQQTFTKLTSNIGSNAISSPDGLKVSWIQIAHYRLRI
jgi:hypothetical protein